VVLLFLIKELYTLLNLNKNVVESFVNKLNSIDIIIINKIMNEHVKYIQDSYEYVYDCISKYKLMHL